MQIPKKVKIIDKETGQERIYDSTKQAAQDIGYKYITIISWLNHRNENKKYTAEYIEK